MLEERGQLSAALDEYYRALFLEPKSMEIARRVSEVALEMGDPERSLEFAKRALELDPTDIRSQWLQGTALLNQGHDQEAIGPLKAAFDADTERVEYARTLARAAEKLDQYDLLARCYRRVVWLDDDDAEAWFQVAAAEARQGHFGAADTALTAAEERNPVRPGIYFLRGWISESLGRTTQAREAYAQHLQVHPDDQAALRRYIGLLAREKQYSAAAREARTLVRAEPDDLEAVRVELEMLFESGATKEAMREIERLRRERPNDVDALSIRVGALARHGRSSEAVAEADRYVKSHPGEMAPQLIAARAADLAGQHDQAATRLEAVVRSAPDSLAPRVMLGRAYESANRRSGACLAGGDRQVPRGRGPGIRSGAVPREAERPGWGGGRGARRARPRALQSHRAQLPRLPAGRPQPEARRGGGPDPACAGARPQQRGLPGFLGWAYYRQGPVGRRPRPARGAISSPMIRSSTSTWVTSTGDAPQPTRLGPSTVCLATDEDNSGRAKLSRIC
jgi:tetratricopeptide (TPR) repeat protein